MLQYFPISSIRSITAAEPAVGLHEALQVSVDALGLTSRYTILSCGGEADSLLPALRAAGAKLGEHGTFDSIVAVRSLCSVPHAEESVKLYYDLLRPGGKILMFEHVVNEWQRGGGSLLGWTLQIVYSLLGWSHFIGGCRLMQDTLGMVRRAALADGGWAMEEVVVEQEKTPMPFVAGTFVKRS